MATVLVEKVSEGTILFPNEGLTCLTYNKPYTVEEDDHGLFIPCTAGKHYLDGQAGKILGVPVYFGLSLSPWGDL